MKRLIFLTVLTATLMAMLSWINCSNPLEAGNNPDPVPPDVDTVYQTIYDTTLDTLEGETLIVVDTVIETLFDTVSDTLIDTVIDTIIEEDTIIDTLIDTVTVVDTLVDTVYVPEGEYFTICTIIEHNLNEIIWTFVNDAGDYNLLFTATAARDFTFRNLILNIDGTEYLWNPTSSPEFTVDQYLSEGATIRVRPDQPLLLGHKVDLCLTLGQQ